MTFDMDFCMLILDMKKRAERFPSHNQRTAAHNRIINLINVWKYRSEDAIKNFITNANLRKDYLLEEIREQFVANNVKKT